jgi:hypothetical protein
MKIAILSESPVDEVAIRILAEAILGRTIELVPPGRLRPGGCSSVVQAAATELIHLYYQTDAEGLIILVDSDDSPAHDPSHRNTPQFTCRVCQIEKAVQRAQASLNRIPGRGELRVAIGFPVPAIEAWFRCGKDPHAAEAPFLRELAAGRTLEQARRQLKREAYGAKRPQKQRQIEVAIGEARRLAGDLERLRTQFPLGFGLFYETLATWR